MPHRKVIVIGAGIGGLVAALELAHAGLSVRVLERAPGPGGKMRTIPTDAGPVDAGPTVFTMAEVFEELFDAVDETLSGHLDLTPLDCLARHHWRGSETLDLFADRARSRDAIGAFAGAEAARSFDAFFTRTGFLFDTLEEPVMRAADPGPLSVATATVGRALSLLRAMAPFSSYWSVLTRSFQDPRLRQLFGRYATYVGGSPFLSPGILALIWQAEARGVAVLDGGMAALATTLETLCQARGVRFDYRTHVEEIILDGGRVTSIRTAEGDMHHAGSVLYNGDPAALQAGLLGSGVVPAGTRRKIHQRSLSAWVWTFAGRPSGARPTHHNVFFSDNSQAEFDDLFRIRRTPVDPTLYLCAQDRGNASAGPERAERFQIIMNAPADGDSHAPTDQEIRQCEKKVFARFAEAGLILDPPQAENALTTPWDFHNLFPGTGGAIYGATPHALTATFRRPRARTRIEGLYLAGGAVHPGPGVPMVALSGRQAAAAILADRVSTSGSRRTAMRGGMSMESPTTAGAVSRSSGS